MATIDALVTDLQNWTSASSTVLPATTCVEFVNTAIRRLQRRRAYQAEHLSVDLTFGATVGVVPLPLDYVAETGVWQKDTAQTDPAMALRSITRTLRPTWVQGTDPDNTRDTIYPNVASPGASASTTGSFLYYTWAGTLTIVPTPNATLTVQLDYVRKLPELIAATAEENTFLRLYTDVVRDGALVEAYRYLHQWDVALAYEQVFAMKVQEAILADTAPTAAGATKPSKGR